MKLTPAHLQRIEREIISNPNFYRRQAWIANTIGVSRTTILKANHLVLCHPTIWKEVLNGRLSVTEAYIKARI
jgi:hypothetical protein